ncbi:membrane hypothetical protein [Thiomonas sp. X19]|nr:membrane hypothetical protein [Thiomonas sp. X19]
MRHLTPSPRVLDRVGLLAAGGAMVIAASVVLGWLTPMTFLLLHVTSGPPTVLWVAATNLLAAAVVLTHGRLPKPLRTKVVAAAGAAIVMLSLLSLVELLTGWDVGLDFVSLHAAVEWANEHPGRASPYASAAMLMLGVAMLSLGVPKRVYARLVALVAIVALGGVGLGGLVVYVLHIEFLNVLPHQTGLAATTALVFVLLGIALLVAWTQADRPATFALSDFQKINLLALAALTLVALVIGIGALAIMQRQMVSREQSFMLNLVQAQRQAMDAAMTGAITQAQKATRSVLGADAGDPESPSEAVVANLRDSFAYGAHAWLEQGYSSVRWMSPSGALVMGFGRRLWANARVLPVHAVVPASLNWDQATYSLVRRVCAPRTFLPYRGANSADVRGRAAPGFGTALDRGRGRGCGIACPCGPRASRHRARSVPPAAIEARRSCAGGLRRSHPVGETSPGSRQRLGTASGCPAD